jgi:hypothetical protein
MEVYMLLLSQRTGSMLLHIRCFGTETIHMERKAWDFGRTAPSLLSSFILDLQDELDEE